MDLRLNILRFGIFLACVFSTLLSPTLSAHAAELVVISNPASPVTSLSREQVSDLFLGKTTSLPGFCCPALVDQPESSPLRDAFYSGVTGKTAAQAKSAWAKLYFTGKGIMPKEGGGSDEIRKMVANNKNMLGYIEKSAADNSVKIIFVAP